MASAINKNTNLFIRIWILVQLIWKIHICNKTVTCPKISTLYLLGCWGHKCLLSHTKHTWAFSFKACSSSFVLFRSRLSFGFCCVMTYGSLCFSTSKIQVIYHWVKYVLYNCLKRWHLIVMQMYSTIWKNYLYQLKQYWDKSIVIKTAWPSNYTFA